MLTVIKQETDYQHGNDCMQKNCYTIIHCHDMYIVMNIRRYAGWCDSGLEIVNRKDFDNIFDALKYYEVDLRKM